MTSKIRYLLLSLSSCLVFLGFTYIVYKDGEASKRLVDLTLTSFETFAFLGMIVAEVVISVLLLASGAGQTRKELQKLKIEISRAIENTIRATRNVDVPEGKG